MGFKEKFAFVVPPSIEHEVGGKTFRFSPISVEAVFKLGKIARPLAQALTTLFSPNREDTRQIFRKIGPNEERVQDGLDPKLAALRTEQRERSIETIVATLSEPLTRTILVELIVDSCREHFGESPDATEVKSFFDKLPAPIFMEFLVGLGKGNAKVLGPLAGRAADLARETFDLSAPPLPQPAPPPSPSPIPITPAG